MLKGKNALVTGSTSGIGYAVARALARAGANVTLNGFGDPAEIDKLRAALKAETNVEVAYSAADMTEAEVKREVLLAAQPTKEFVTVEQVSSLAVYLSFDGAAEIAGANLAMDGKWTAA